MVAIEPAHENIVCLRRNFAEEIAAGKIVIYEKGVWDREDLLTLRISPDNSAADTFVLHQEGSIEGSQVPVTTVDRLVSELKLTRVDFIKMDVEGSEQKALAGARLTLSKYHPRMAISAYHLADDPERIPVIVRQIWPGYKMECGPCAETRGRIRPDVLYFH